MKKIIPGYCFYVSVFLLNLTLNAQQNYYVDDAETNGSGTFESPFNDITSALVSQNPGDTVYIMPGTYEISSSIFSKKEGTPEQPIQIRAFDPNDRPVLTGTNVTMFRLIHSNYVIDGLILDGRFFDNNFFSLKNTPNNITIRNCEIKNGKRDAIILFDVRDIFIENCRIYNILRKENGGHFDAHGVLGYHQKNLQIRNTEIFWVTGDCVQADPSFEAPGWDTLIIEDCHFWTSPLPSDRSDFSAGEIPGENAIDLKTMPEDIRPAGYRPYVYLKNLKAGGFVRNPPDYSDRAAFLIKHNVRCIMENCIAYGSEIGYRLRGPYTWNTMDIGGAEVSMYNCIAYDNEKAIWLERNIAYAHIYNCTFDKDADTDWYFDEDSEYVSAGFEMQNCLFTGTKPVEASDNSNLGVDTSVFYNYSKRDFHLVDNDLCIDKGLDIPGLTTDFDGLPRTAGKYDIGAYEFNPAYVPSGIQNTKKESFKVYPNPAKDYIMVQFEESLTESNSNVVVSVFDLTGRKVFGSDYDAVVSLVRIPTKTLNKGIYFVKVLSSSRELKAAKIIIEN